MVTQRPSVRIPQGTVVGLTLTDGLPRPVEAFRGIPYALPPTGSRRFFPALPVKPSPDATIDASAYGPAAPGKPLLAGPPLKYSEDCLHANVFRHIPKAEASGSKPLPVAIYFHGGAFNRGTSSGHNTASFVAWSEESFVAVTFNYRLGALGFLPSSASAKEGVLNLGLKDQIVLMEWVRDNISYFGGDPNNVTLFGLSAGAHSIGHHLMNYKEGQVPLYHRVILESGAPTSRAVRPYDALIHEEQFIDFLKEVGCPNNCPEDQIFPYLRSLPIDVISAAQTAVFDKYNPSLRWAFQPVIDGDIIPRPPLETWSSGKWNKVPVITGFTRNEGGLYVDKQMSRPGQFRSFFVDLLPLFASSDIDAIERLYPDPSTYPDSKYAESRQNVGPQYQRIEQAYAHYAYVAPVRQTAEFASAEASVPVYLYQWALEATVLEGARHGDNARYETCEPYVLAISPTQSELARILHSYIASFIITGDPNAMKCRDLDRPRWEAYKVAKPTAMVFGEKNKELVGGSPGPAAEMLADTWVREECKFWWNKVDLSQQ